MTFIQPTTEPTEVDARLWLDELKFTFQGIPKQFLPPIDAVDYVEARYREDVSNLRIHDREDHRYQPLHPYFSWSIRTVCMAHFAWFTRRNGALWVMRLHEVQEVEPFREASSYFWVRPGTSEMVSLVGPACGPIYRTIDGRNVHTEGLALKIYRKWGANHSPPCSKSNPEVLRELKQIVTETRQAPPERKMPEIPDDMWFWASEVIRNWMIESNTDDHWPYRKGGRISGGDWIASIERAPGVPLYEPLMHMDGVKGDRVYRISEPSKNNTAAHWCEGDEIKIVPSTDLIRMQHGHDEEALKKTFECSSCRTVRSCTPYTGASKKCCNCYGIENESGARPTLDKCTMTKECRNCPSRIDSETDLIALKTRLNSSPRRGPVPR